MEFSRIVSVGLLAYFLLCGDLKNDVKPWKHYVAYAVLVFSLDRAFLVPCALAGAWYFGRHEEWPAWTEPQSIISEAIPWERGTAPFVVLSSVVFGLMMRENYTNARAAQAAFNYAFGVQHTPWWMDVAAERLFAFHVQTTGN